MKRPPARRAVLPVSLALALCALLGGGSAATAAGPFRLPPSPMKECNNLQHCFGITGPWVVVPAQGEATWRLACPVRARSRNAFIVGGTDALASSKAIRVWFDGALGAPIGAPAQTSVGLLFHAVSENGQAGSFQPILGCINVRQAAKRSTVSARLASAPPKAPHSAPAPNPRATQLVLEPGWKRTLTVSCHKREAVAGTWGSYAFGTVNPPEVPEPGAVRIAVSEQGRTVQARVQTAPSVSHLILVQVGAVCQP